MNPKHGDLLMCCQDVIDQTEDQLGEIGADRCGFFWLSKSMERTDKPRAIVSGWYYRSSFESGFLATHVGPLRFCPFCGAATPEPEEPPDPEREARDYTSLTAEPHGRCVECGMESYKRAGQEMEAHGRADAAMAWDGAPYCVGSGKRTRQ